MCHKRRYKNCQCLYFLLSTKLTSYDNTVQTVQFTATVFAVNSSVGFAADPP